MPARKKMLKLFCGIVGVAGSACLVRVDESVSADDLDEAINEKNSNDLTDVDTKNLQLFPAKTEG
ncbi:hypothetical protein Plhal304r1_c064g0151441 [Plasmopara halstedii]